MWVTRNADEEQIATTHRTFAERFCRWGCQEKTNPNSSPAQFLKSQISRSKRNFGKSSKDLQTHFFFISKEFL